MRTLLVLLLLASPAVAQVTGPPFTFVNGTVADADEVNQDFSTIYSAALNRLGVGTMAGALIFSPDNTYDIGASGTTRPRDLFLGRNAVIGGTLAVTGALTGAIPETSIVDGAILARVASAETISGQWMFTATSYAMQLTNAAPGLLWTESDVGGNGRNWLLAASGETFVLQAMDGSLVTAVPALTIARSTGTTTLTTFDIGVPQTRHPDGTSGAPSVSFTSDPDVGLYRVSANILGIAATSGLYVPDAVRFASATTTGFGPSGGELVVTENGVAVASFDSVNGLTMLGRLQLSTQTFAGLGTPSNGVLLYCVDCTIADPCAGSGAGAVAKRIAGTWKCN